MRCPSLNELPPPPPGKRGWPWTEESWRCPDAMSDGTRWPSVSIITPSYNQGHFIEETIRSVLLQGYPDLEYMILDGGSTDGSVEIIRRYSQWLSYWVSEPDRGQTHAINAGWARASGEVVAYINTDDCYIPGAIGTVVRRFAPDFRPAMVYGTAEVVDEAGHRLRTWEAQPFDLKVMLTAGNVVPQAAAFFSHRALEQAGYLDENWHMIMDYELCIRLGMRFPSVCLAQTLARFRDHSQSKSRSYFETTAKEVLQLLDRLLPEEISPGHLRMIKRAAASRVHYEMAMGYLAEGPQQAIKALRPLVQSMLLFPGFALGRPLQTAYAVKEMALGFLRVARQRFSAKAI